MDRNLKIIAGLTVLGVLLAKILPLLHVPPEVAAEVPQLCASLITILAAYLHTSPDVPIPDAWQEAFGKVVGLLGLAGTFAPLVAIAIGHPSSTATIIGWSSAVAGALGAFAKKSPTEAHLASPATNRPPVVLPILIFGLVIPSAVSAAGSTPLYPQPSAPKSTTKTSTASEKPVLSFGPSAMANIAGWRLSGDARSVPLGAGAGLRCDFVLLGLPLRAGLYGAPVLSLGDGSVFNFATLVSLEARQVLQVPIGVALGWLAFSAGGPEPGIHPLHASHLIVSLALGVPLFD